MTEQNAKREVKGNEKKGRKGRKMETHIGKLKIEGYDSHHKHEGNATNENADKIVAKTGPAALQRCHEGNDAGDGM